MLASLFCADRPFLPSVTEYVVVNWEQLHLAWQVRYNPVYNTTYTAWFWNRWIMKYCNCQLYVVSGNVIGW